VNYAAHVNAAKELVDEITAAGGRAIIFNVSSIAAIGTAVPGNARSMRRPRPKLRY